MKGKVKYVVSFILIVVIFTILIGIVNDMGNTSTKVKGDIVIWANDRTYDYLSEAAEKFMVTNDKANIQIEKIYEYEYEEKLEMDLDKISPNIVQVSSKELYNIILSDKNKVQSVNKIIDNYSKSFSKGRLEEVTYDNELLAIPLTSRPIVLYLREDMLNRFDHTYEDINTWDDIINVGKDIYSKSNGKVRILNATGQDYEDIISLLIMQTLEDVEDNELTTTETIKERVNEKISNLSINNILNTDDGGEFLARIASINGMRELSSIDVECKWVASKAPGKTPGGNRSYVADGENLVVINNDNNTEDNKELIRRFIGLLTSNNRISTNHIQQGELFISYLGAYKNKSIEEKINNFEGQSPLVTMVNITEKAPEIKDYNLYNKVKDDLLNSK